MIESMTGFSCIEKKFLNKKINLEIKTLNSKYLNINFNLPFIYRNKELILRKKISKFFIRGKIEVNLYLHTINSCNKYFLDSELIHFYMNSIKNIIPGFKEIQYFNLIMKIPDILKPLSESINEKEWIFIENLFDYTITSVKKIRQEEGKFLSNDFIYRIKNILNFLDHINSFKEERRNIIQNKIKKQFSNKDIFLDPIRLEQELFFYLEKIDITEEYVRLKKHCEYFIQVLIKEKNQGKKLSFIIQEIFREINTLGVKSQHIKIQKFVILIKEELEKIREQIANIL